MLHLPRFQPQRLPIIGIIVAIFGVFFVLTSSTLADDRAVTLKYFFAEPLADGSVHIEWETGTEQDTAFFYIIRLPAPDDPSFPTDVIELVYQVNATTTITTSAIPGLGNPGSGAKYIAFDRNTQPGQTYNYALVEEDIAKFFRLEAFATVTIGDIATPGITLVPPTSIIESSTLGAIVTHTFQVTNSGNRRTGMVAKLDDTGWESNFVTSSGLRLKSFLLPQLEPNESISLTVETTIPTATTGCSSNVAVFSLKAETFMASTTKIGRAVTKLPGNTLCTFLPTVNS